MQTTNITIAGDNAYHAVGNSLAAVLEAPLVHGDRAELIFAFAANAGACPSKGHTLKYGEPMGIPAGGQLFVKNPNSVGITITFTE